MSNESYLQQLRCEYIQMGEYYIQAIRDHKPGSEIRHISRAIKSIMVEIRAMEQEMRRKTA